jgi:hypothetical protein
MITFEQIEEATEDLLRNRRFVALRTLVTDIEKSEKLYHKINLAQKELNLIKMIRDFGPSTYVALQATSNDEKSRRRTDEIVNGRVTSDLFKSDCPPELWDENIIILEEHIEELKARQDKISKLEEQIARA